MGDLIPLSCFTGNLECLESVLSEIDVSSHQSDVHLSLSIALVCGHDHLVDKLFEYYNSESEYIQSYLSDSALHKLERITEFCKRVLGAQKEITNILSLEKEQYDIICCDEDEDEYSESDEETESDDPYQYISDDDESEVEIVSCSDADCSCGRENEDEHEDEDEEEYIKIYNKRSNSEPSYKKNKTKEQKQMISANNNKQLIKKLLRNISEECNDDECSCGNC